MLHVADEPCADLQAAFDDRERFRVERTATPAEAFVELGDGADCIVCDPGVGEEESVEFLRAVREDRPDLPFVLFPWDGSEELASRAVAAGVTDYLPKDPGADGWRLADRVEAAVRRYRSVTEAGASRTRFRALADGLAHAIVEIDPESTVRFANRAVEDVFGYAPEAIEGESLTRLMPERLRDRHRRGLRRYHRAGERTLDWRSVEFYGLHADGHEVPLEITFCEYARGGRERYIGIVRDVTERKRRLRKLRELQAATRDLMEAEDHESVCEVAFMTARDVLGYPLTGVWLYDPDVERLRPVATPRGFEEAFDVGEVPTYVPGDPAWQAFSKRETRVRDVDADRTTDSDPPIRRELIAPLGEHGVMIHRSPSADAFSESDVRFTGILAANAEAALNRADREQEILRQRDDLDALNRLNELIRELIRALIQAESLDGIERTVCDHLVDSAPYERAWIGGVTARNDTLRLRPRDWAGISDGRLEDEIAITGDDPVEAAAERAVRSGETRFVDGPPAESAFATWSSEDGKESIAIVPLGYEGTTYAVLAIYDARGAFTDRKREGFQVLGDAIGFVINAIRTEKLLLSDAVVELELRLSGRTPLADLSDRLGQTCRMEGLVPGEGGTLLQYVHVEGDTGAPGAEEVAPEIDRVERARCVDEDTLEIRVTESAPKTLVGAGTTVRSVRAEDGELRVVADAADEVDARRAVEACRTDYPETTLVAKRTVERPAKTAERSLDDRVELTEKQRQALVAAYSAGYFDWPRDSTGEEIAESLGISPPTFHSHLRKAQRQVVTEFLGDPTRIELE